MGSVAAGPALPGLSAYLPGPNLTAWIAVMCLDVTSLLRESLLQ